MRSLRQRMAVTMLCGLLLGAAVGAVGLYWQSREELDELFGDHLPVVLKEFAPRVAVDVDEVRRYRPEAQDAIVLQLWQDGRLRASSDPSLTPPLLGRAGSALVAAPGGGRWYVSSQALPDHGSSAWLQVAQSAATRRRLAAASTLHLLGPLFLSMPVLVVFMIGAVSRQLLPLRALARQLQERNALQHRQLSPVPDMPGELLPVVAALDDLLLRQSDAARRQQAFLADAAHELRTPLAVIRLQAQRVKSADTGAERHDALDSLHLGIARAERLVAQLLALARSEPGVPQPAARCQVDLTAMLKTVLAEHYPRAVERHIDLGLLESPPCQLPGEPDGLLSLIGNLIDNALRHTPRGGRIDVLLATDPGWARLEIADTGPGIPPERRQQVFERFERGGVGGQGPHGPGDQSFGIGLAIVRQVVARHAGKVELVDHAGGGLKVRVLLPLGPEGAGVGGA